MGLGYGVGHNIDNDHLVAEIKYLQSSTTRTLLPLTISIVGENFKTLDFFVLFSVGSLKNPVVLVIKI